jgi:hypothetical protein
MTRDEVRMEVSQKDVADLHSKPFRIVQVLLNIPLRTPYPQFYGRSTLKWTGPTTTFIRYQVLM